MSIVEDLRLPEPTLAPDDDAEMLAINVTATRYAGGHAYSGTLAGLLASEHVMLGDRRSFHLCVERELGLFSLYDDDGKRFYHGRPAKRVTSKPLLDQIRPRFKERQVARRRAAEQMIAIETAGEPMVFAVVNGYRLGGEAQEQARRWAKRHRGHGCWWVPGPLWGHGVALLDEEWAERICPRRRGIQVTAGEPIVKWCVDNVTDQTIVLGPMIMSAASALRAARGAGIGIADRAAAMMLVDSPHNWGIHGDG